MTKRITYVSRFSKPLEAQELQDLGDVSAEKNRRLDITGFLMVSGGLFYQVLEGPRESVDELYASIASDDRHTDLLLLRAEDNVTTRLYPDWSMKTINLDAASHIRFLPVKALVKAVFEQQRLIDNMIWAIERTVHHEVKDI